MSTKKAVLNRLSLNAPKNWVPKRGAKRRLVANAKLFWLMWLFRLLWGFVGGVVIHQNAMCGTFQIVELTAFARPPKEIADNECQNNTDGDKDKYAFH